MGCGNQKEGDVSMISAHNRARIICIGLWITGFLTGSMLGARSHWTLSEFVHILLGIAYSVALAHGIIAVLGEEEAKKLRSNPEDRANR